jgi:hypothetical protein
MLSQAEQGESEGNSDLDVKSTQQLLNDSILAELINRKSARRV